MCAAAEGDAAMRTEAHYAEKNNFTTLRLVLALMVLLGHYKIFIGVTHPPLLFSYAMAAVQCFFVVSGYLITNSFDRDSDLQRFYIRRFFRIYPLYVAIVAVQTVILGLLDPAGFVANAGPLLKYFALNAVFLNFLDHNVGHGLLAQLVDPNLNPSLWTLKIEVGFYLILPFLWMAVRRFGAAVLVIIFIVSAIYYEAFDLAGNHEFAKQLPGQLQYFVLGIAAYRYRDKLVMGKNTSLVLAATFGVLFTLLMGPQPPVIYPLVVGAFVAFTALKTPPVRLRTDISYGVYLLHAPVIQLSLLFGLYRSGWLGVVETVAVVILLSLAVERLIERPGIALGRRLSRKPHTTESAPTIPSAAAPIGGNPGLTVLMLNDFCYVQGGASKVAIGEAVALAKLGVQVIFLGAVGPVCSELRDVPVVVECLGQKELLDVSRHPLVAVQGLWNLKAARRTRAILRMLPRDRTIVHLHGYTKALTASPVRAARRLGFPVICTLHDFFAACPNGAFFDYPKERPCMKHALSLGCVVTQCDKRRYAHKLFRVTRGLVQRGFARFPGAVRDYISLSRRSASILSPYLPPQARLYPLRDSIDAVRSAPVAVARNRTILYVGRLDPEKGVRLLAEATKRLGLDAVFVGDGPLRAELEAVSGVSVTGWLSRDEIRPHLACARCLVFPSLWYETYGLTVDEAAACGVPAIVSDISAAAERVQDGVTGWRFRSGDASDLARRLTLIGDDALVRAAGLAAYNAYWRNRGSTEAHAGQLVSIYRLAMQN
jgi:peptidoglycan/LPS O-acetylase OafA/YrhL/glycosyltransferase involved in cell wall biosynthesis